MRSLSRPCRSPDLLQLQRALLPSTASRVPLYRGGTPILRRALRRRTATLPAMGCTSLGSPLSSRTQSQTADHRHVALKVDRSALVVELKQSAAAEKVESLTLILHAASLRETTSGPRRCSWGGKPLCEVCFRPLSSQICAYERKEAGRCASETRAASADSSASRTHPHTMPSCMRYLVRCVCCTESGVTARHGQVDYKEVLDEDLGPLAFCGSGARDPLSRPLLSGAAEMPAHRC